MSSQPLCFKGELNGKSANSKQWSSRSDSGMPQKLNGCLVGISMKHLPRLLEPRSRKVAMQPDPDTQVGIRFEPTWSIALHVNVSLSDCLSGMHDVTFPGCEDALQGGPCQAPTTQVHQLPPSPGDSLGSYTDDGRYRCYAEPNPGDSLARRARHNFENSF